MLSVVVLTAACSSDVYKDKRFFSKNNLNGQTLAVLPAEVTYNGNLPKSWDAARIAKMEIQQSARLQQEIHDDFLFNASGKRIKKKYDVKLLDIKIVNDKLLQAGVSVQDSWKMTSAELAKIVGADMLVRARVENMRYMSQAAASGINIGASVIEGLLNKNNSTASVGLPHVRAGETDLDLSLYHSSQSSAIARFDTDRRLRVKKLPVYVWNTGS